MSDAFIPVHAIKGRGAAPRMKSSGLWAELVHQRFKKACARFGLNRERVELDLTQFRPGLSAGQGRAGQGSLF